MGFFLQCWCKSSESCIKHMVYVPYFVLLPCTGTGDGEYRGVSKFHYLPLWSYRQLIPINDPLIAVIIFCVKILSSQKLEGGQELYQLICFYFVHNRRWFLDAHKGIIFCSKFQKTDPAFSVKKCGVLFTWHALPKTQKRVVTLQYCYWSWHEKGMTWKDWRAPNLAPILKGTQAWNFFFDFFAETETIWSQGPVTRDF